MYTVGNTLRIGLFGKSHDDFIGCYVDGLPEGMEIDTGRIARAMELRKPRDGIGTPRKEPDEVILEEGVEDGRVVGRVLIKIMNTNRRSSSYSGFNVTPRPGHADLPALMKFKDFDVSGGAQFSGRMTAPLVAAGAIASQYLEAKGIRVAAYTKSIGNVADPQERSFEEIDGSKKFKTRREDDRGDTRCFRGRGQRRRGGRVHGDRPSDRVRRHMVRCAGRLGCQDDVLDTCRQRRGVRKRVRDLLDEGFREQRPVRRQGRQDSGSDQQHGRSVRRDERRHAADVRRRFQAYPLDIQEAAHRQPREDVRRPDRDQRQARPMRGPSRCERRGSDGRHHDNGPGPVIPA